MDVISKLVVTAGKLFQQHGVLETSMRMIIKESGLATGTVYRAISNKEDLLVIMYTQQIEIALECQQKMLTSSLSAREKLICITVVSMMHNRLAKRNVGTSCLPLNQALYKNADDNVILNMEEKIDIIQNNIKKYIEKCITSGDILSEVKVEELFYYIMVIARGTQALAMPVIAEKFSFDTFSVTIEIMNSMFNNIQWNNKNQTINPQNIKLVARTTIDQYLKQIDML